MAFMNQLTRRGLASSARLNAQIKEFVVIGGGLMGAGIAQVILFSVFISAKFLIHKIVHYSTHKGYAYLKNFELH